MNLGLTVHNQFSTKEMMAAAVSLLASTCTLLMPESFAVATVATMALVDACNTMGTINTLSMPAGRTRQDSRTTVKLAQAAMRADLAMELDEAQWRPPAVAAEGFTLDFSAGSFACFETVDGGKRSWVCV